MNELEQQPMKIATLGHLKSAFRRHDLPIYVWVSWQGEDGDYIEVSKSAFLRGIGADVAFHRDGRHNDTQISAEIRYGDGIYIN